MKLDEWLKVYEEILSDFNFARESDENSAKLIHDLGRGKLLDKEIIERVVKDRVVAIIGGAVKSEIDVEVDVIITAGKAILRWIELSDKTPNIHVTDMEEDLDVLLDLNKKGCILVLHAHGDNAERIRKIVPYIPRFVATTQSIPFNRVYNFGGFTDGDRAAIMAKELGARKVILHGFEFKGEGIKGKKLKWAEKILRKEGLI